MQLAVMSGFFTQAVAVITYIPRIPEFIAQLGVSFAEWGLIIGLAGAGSFIPLFITNRLVSRFGTKPLVIISFIGFCLMLMTLPTTTNPIIYFFLQATLNFMGSFYNISVNAQAVMLQKRIGKVIIGRFHASWSIGAAMSAMLSGILASFMPLWLHMILVPGVCLIVFLIFSRHLMTPAEDGHAEERERATKTPFFKSPNMVWLLSAGLFAGVFPELCMMDWSAVFSQKVLGLNATLGAFPYFCFTAAMIIGRLLIGRLTKRWHLSSLAKVGGVVASVVLAASIFVGPAVAGADQTLGLIVTAGMWSIVGLGIGPMVPSFFSAAGYIKGMPTAQALSRMSLVNQMTILVAKIGMGALTQKVGVALAFVFPVVALFAAGVLAGAVVKRSPRAEEGLTSYPPTGPITTIDS